MDVTPITCLCGAIRLALSGEPIAQFYCHCDDCRAVHGAAYLPIAMYPADAVRVTHGTPNMWALKTTARATCATCGCRVFADVPQLGVRCVSAHLLPPGRFEPEFHMQCRFAVMPVADDLPHFERMPPRFGGSDSSVGW